VPDELLRRAVDVLLKLRTISEVPARRYDAQSADHTGDDGDIPIRFTAAGDLARSEPSDFLLHRSRINASRTPLDLELAVVNAEEALRAARHQSTPLERMKPEEARSEVVAWHNQLGMSAVEIASKGDYKVRWVLHVLRTHREQD
jgi:hypothetical protein